MSIQAMSPADSMIMGGCMLNVATKVCCVYSTPQHVQCLADVPQAV